MKSKEWLIRRLDTANVKPRDRLLVRQEDEQFSDSEPPKKLRQFEAGESCSRPQRRLDHSIPPFLIWVLSKERENAVGSHALLVTAVHAVMLESGFVGFELDVSSALVELGFGLPEGWTIGEPVSFRYTLRELTTAGCENREYVKLKFKFGVDSFVVRGRGHYGPESRGSHHCLSLKVGKFASSVQHAAVSIVQKSSDKPLAGFPRVWEVQDSWSHEKVLSELWRLVKDNISGPLHSDMCEKIGLALPSSLVTLPLEIKMKIFEALPAVDVAKMGCVCKEFRVLTRNDALWKCKYVEEYDLGRIERFPLNGKIPMGAQTWKEGFVRILMEGKRRVGLGGFRGGPFERQILALLNSR